MLDIRRIINEKEVFLQAMANRNANLDFDKLSFLDENRRKLLGESETLKARRNAVAAERPKLLKQGQDVSSLKEEMKAVGDRIKAMDDELRNTEEELQGMLLAIPNIPDSSVPVGNDENDNAIIRTVGEPRKFDFEPKPHWEIGEEQGMLDFTRAAKVTGARFTFCRGLGARLERSVFNFMMDTHAKNGYTEIFPPFMVNRASMTGTGQLPKFEDDAFKVVNTDYFLIPTAEVPVTNMYSNEIIEELPQSFCAYSACFRAEAGSAGRDTRGLIRQHQFNKVELVKFTRPEESFEHLELMTKDAERILQLLELPYRVSLLCTGDMGFASAKTYDIEVWMPSYNRYVETSSCSNICDYQSRRLGIRYRPEQGAKPQFAHTLNGSGLAVGRTVAAILENFQTAEGNVNIPKALHPYMGMSGW